MRAMIIHSLGKTVVSDIRPGLKEKRRIVKGDIECITLDEGFTIQMYFNGFGKLEHLPYNEFATTLYRAYFATEDWIAGDAVICGCDFEGNSCDLTDEQIEELIKKMERSPIHLKGKS